MLKLWTNLLVYFYHLGFEYSLLSFRILQQAQFSYLTKSLLFDYVFLPFIEHGGKMASS